MSQPSRSFTSFGELLAHNSVPEPGRPAFSIYDPAESESTNNEVVAGDVDNAGVDGIGGAAQGYMQSGNPGGQQRGTLFDSNNQPNQQQQEIIPKWGKQLQQDVHTLKEGMQGLNQRFDGFEKSIGGIVEKAVDAAFKKRAQQNP